MTDNLLIFPGLHWLLGLGIQEDGLYTDTTGRPSATDLYEILQSVGLHRARDPYSALPLVCSSVLLNMSMDNRLSVDVTSEDCWRGVWYKSYITPLGLYHSGRWILCLYRTGQKMVYFPEVYDISSFILDFLLIYFLLFRNCHI